MNPVEFAIRWLAVFGAFALGGWFTGWLMNYLAGRFFKNKRLPPLPAWVSRMLGGVAFAVIVYLAAFGGGGAGIGGPGGLFGGAGGRPSTDGGKDGTKPKDDEKKKDDRTPTGPGEALRVEVLGDKPLTRLVGSNFDPSHRYRVKGTADLLSLDEVKKRISDGFKADPPLKRLEVVTYDDSPTLGPVQDLISYARDLGPDRIAVKEEKVFQPAP